MKSRFPPLKFNLIKNLMMGGRKESGGQKVKFGGTSRENNANINSRFFSKSGKRFDNRSVEIHRPPISRAFGECH